MKRITDNPQRRSSIGRIESMIVEDNPRDRNLIVEKLSDSGVFNVQVYDRYANLRRPATTPGIVSLDREALGSTISPAEICMRIRKWNPDQNIVFFTSKPHEVVTQPVNFVLEKNAEVWDSYQQLLMRIVVFDSIIDVMGMLGFRRPTSDAGMLDIRHELEMRIIPNVQLVHSYFSEVDNPAADRYQDLSTLMQFIHEGADPKHLKDALKPLFRHALKELDEVLTVNGVVGTPRLTHTLEKMNEWAIRPRYRDVVMNAIKYSMDKTAVKIFDVLKAAGMPDLGFTTLINPFTGFELDMDQRSSEDEIVEKEASDFDEEPERIEGEAVSTRSEVSTELEPTVEDKTWPAFEPKRGEEHAVESESRIDKIENKTDDSDDQAGTDEEQSPLFLNSWFPEKADTELVKDETTLLRVNISYQSIQGENQDSEAIPAAKAKLLFATPYVDVMAVSADALIEPFIKRLDMPPNDEKFVEFEFTPLTIGKIEYTIVLLIRNEPIFRTQFSCDATAAIMEAALS